MSANKTLLSIGLLLVLPVAAHAESVKYTSELRALTDGIYRGISQTEGRPQYIAGAQAAYGKVFVGVLYKSMRDAASGVDNQTQVMLGYKTKLIGNDVTARAIFKQYNGTRTGIDNEFVEYEVNTSRKLTKKLTGKLNLAYSPDNYGKAETATYAEWGLDYKLTPKLTVQVANGFRHNQYSTDYTSYMTGVSYAVTPKFSASLTFTATDKSDLAARYGDSTFITLSKKF